MSLANVGYPGRGMGDDATAPMTRRMSLHDQTDDLASLSNGELMRLLSDAEEQERFLSEERRTVHYRLDSPDGVSGAEADSLAALQHAERTISERRLELHQRITELRMERGRRVSGLRPRLRVVD